MPHDEVIDQMQGLLQRPALYPETQRLIELAIEAQRTGVMPSLNNLSTQPATRSAEETASSS